MFWILINRWNFLSDSCSRLQRVRWSILSRFTWSSAKWCRIRTTKLVSEFTATIVPRCNRFVISERFLHFDRPFIFCGVLLDVGKLRHRTRKCHKRPPQSHAQTQRRRDGQRMAALLRSTFSSFCKFDVFFRLFSHTHTRKKTCVWDCSFVPVGYKTARRCPVSGRLSFGSSFGQASTKRPVGIITRSAIVRVSFWFFFSLSFVFSYFSKRTNFLTCNSTTV